MRLLLDEMYDRAIAEQLRQRGRDVVAATERADLRGIDDASLPDWMAAERRAVLTENAADFVPAVQAMLEDGRTCFGVVFTSPKTMPRSRNTIGLYIAELERFLAERPAEDALVDQVVWLTPA